MKRKLSTEKAVSPQALMKLCGCSPTRRVPRPTTVGYRELHVRCQ